MHGRSLFIFVVSTYLIGICNGVLIGSRLTINEQPGAVQEVQK